MSDVDPSRPPIDGAVRRLICGAVAGLAVDLSLYPLDTCKTRLQSSAGFLASGGFTRLYAGIPSVAIGSAPSAALFFLTYGIARDNNLSALVAASFGEVAACLVRVPTELIKQRSQAATSKHHVSMLGIARQIVQRHGIVGLYQGYFSTIAREIPFSIIEFPLWEAFKRAVTPRDGTTSRTPPLASAACGSLAGAIAGALTTPLDVAKTRIMLHEKVHDKVDIGIRSVLADVYAVGGVRGLFAGVVPRTLWMAIGGFIFFGAYESSLALSYRIRPRTPDEIPVDITMASVFDEKYTAQTMALTEKRKEFMERRQRILDREKDEYKRLDRFAHERRNVIVD